MTIADQLPQGLDRTGYLVTDSGVLMLHYGAIKVYCYYHRAKLSLFSSFLFPRWFVSCRGREKEISPSPTTDGAKWLPLSPRNPYAIPHSRHSGDVGSVAYVSTGPLAHPLAPEVLLRMGRPGGVWAQDLFFAT